MFIKYPSIENHYQEKYIQKAVDNDPYLNNCVYVIQEKLHGANISFLFNPNEEFRVYSRNNELDKTSNDFYGLADVLKNMKEFTDRVQKRAELGETISIRLFGELFGGNIQKGVWYGEKKRILFYDLMYDDKLISVSRMIDFMMMIDQVDDWFVHHVYVETSLKDALNSNIKLNSFYTPIEYIKSNVMEGVVIKPYFGVHKDHYGRPFYIKKKNEEFKEKSKTKKVNTKVDVHVEKLKQEFLSYINENRLDSIFSKLGMISEKAQTPVYLRALNEDVLVDFMKDFGDEFMKLDKNSQKYITKDLGKKAIPILFKNL